MSFILYDERRVRRSTHGNKKAKHGEHSEVVRVWRLRSSGFRVDSYLLAQGLDVSAPGDHGLPALGSAQNEDIAMLLSLAGSSWQMDDGGAGFRRYAKDQHWHSVQTWLEQHPGR